MNSASTLLAGDHRELDVILERLGSALAAGDAPASFELLDLFWARLAMHIRAEHLHLFPALESAADDELRKTLEELKEDHNYFMRELVAAIKEMRNMLEADSERVLGSVKARVANVSERLQIHNLTEESYIYLVADRTPTMPSDLTSKMKMELENMPPRFAEKGTAE